MKVKIRQPKPKVRVVYDPKHPTRLEPWTITQIAENFREDSIGLKKAEKEALYQKAREQMREMRNTLTRPMTPGELSVLTSWDL